MRRVASTAVHAWHPDIHEDDVRAGSPGQLAGLDPVTRFADDDEIGFGLEDEPEPGA